MSKERIIKYVDMSFKIAQDSAEVTLRYLNEAKNICSDEEHRRSLEFAANMVNSDLRRLVRERDDVRGFLQRVLPADPDEQDLVTEANKIDES